MQMLQTDLEALLVRLDHVLGPKAEISLAGSTLGFLRDWLNGLPAGVVQQAGRDLESRLNDRLSGKVDLLFGGILISILSASRAAFKVEFPKDYPNLSDVWRDPNEIVDSSGRVYTISDNTYIDPVGYVFQTNSQELILYFLAVLKGLMEKAAASAPADQVFTSSTAARRTASSTAMRRTERAAAEEQQPGPETTFTETLRQLCQHVPAYLEPIYGPFNQTLYVRIPLRCNLFATAGVSKYSVYVDRKPPLDAHFEGMESSDVQFVIALSSGRRQYPVDATPSRDRFVIQINDHEEMKLLWSALIRKLMDFYNALSSDELHDDRIRFYEGQSRFGWR